MCIFDFRNYIIITLILLIFKAVPGITISWIWIIVPMLFYISSIFIFIIMIFASLFFNFNLFNKKFGNDIKNDF